MGVPKSYNRTNPVILQKQKCLSFARLFSKMSPSEELTALLLPLESIEKKQNSPIKTVTEEIVGSEHKLCKSSRPGGGVNLKTENEHYKVNKEDSLKPPFSAST